MLSHNQDVNPELIKDDQQYNVILDQNQSRKSSSKNDDEIFKKNEGSVQIIKVPIEKLIVSEANVRKSEIDHLRLIDDIEENGIEIPLDVWYNKETDIFEIMDGQNRYLCAQDLVDKYPDKFSHLDCILYNTVITLDEAHTWCRRKLIQQKDISKSDMMRIVDSLKKRYGSLRAGCKAENLPYKKLWEWSMIPYEISDSPNFEEADIRVLRELSKLPSEHRKSVFNEIIGLPRRMAIKRIKEVSENAKNPRIQTENKMPVTVWLDRDVYEYVLKMAKDERKSVENKCGEIIDSVCK